MNRYITPPQLAARWGCKPDKVLQLIRKGELRAINLAVDPTGRPRWKLTEEAIQDFEARRTASPAPKQPRRHRRPKGDDFIEYF